MIYSEILLKLFLQITLILFTCRIISYIGEKYFLQSRVVCEMVAGVILGPSIFGLIFPEVQAWFFPKVMYVTDLNQKIPNPSMTILYAISQIGLIFYMFLIGLNFDRTAIQKQFKSASTIALSGVLVPFGLGIAIVYLFSDNFIGMFSEHTSTLTKAVFLGTALSITAFPMMARILEENNIVASYLGTLILAAGSMGDLIAWIMLALLLSIIKDNLYLVLIAIGASIGYICVLYLISISLKTSFLNKIYNSKDNFNVNFSLMLIMLMLFSWFTDMTGINYIFGSFIAGVFMPRGYFSDAVKERMHDFIIVFMLPFFFTYSGLNTQINLINNFETLKVTGLILVIAILGKFCGCMLAARMNGENWQNSTAIGVLMNARGLIELIILNIGLEAKIINHTMFTILVLMAVITTLFASPLYKYIQSYSTDNDVILDNNQI